MRCQATTKKKTQCTIEGAVLDAADGNWKCHVHHPSLTFQQQQQAKADHKAALRAVQTARRQHYIERKYGWLDFKRPPTPSLKDQY